MPVCSSFVFVAGCKSTPPTKKAGGNASHYGEGRDIARYYRAGTDDAAFADGDTREENRSGADICPRFHTHRPDLQIRLDDGPLNW